ncbi:unnamed protein product [Cylindrotheca closterium]|uniref:DUF6824 domain-containing protein n=1 Tax=Cylindrotheca closterium TaxID=2856 RepID=A0AAD2CUP2_9STRA|nr:unnamed protein product [Cylindrotheca closterium]
MTVENPFGIVEPTPMFQSSYAEIKDSGAAVDVLPANIPKEATDIDHVDSMIAQQMSSMTVQDREQAFMDVHGVSPIIEETPELVSSKLEEMESQIQKQHRREAYDMAESMNPDYVRDPEFRLMFLRSDVFNAYNAALRLIRHFEVKRDLFGVDKLTQEITQDDLDQESMDCLYMGHSQQLTTPDRSNRIISLWVSSEDHEKYSVTALLRRQFYQNMHLLRTNKHAQKDGVVAFLYLLGRDSGNPFPYDTGLELPRLANAMPMRLVAFHMAHDNKWLAPLIAFIKYSFNLITRIRIRTHYGSHNECMASMQGHGVPPEILPLEEGGIVTNKDSYREYLRGVRRQERIQFPRRQQIYVPCSYDVLFGKGSSVQTYEGNKRMRRIVTDRQKAYEKAEKGRKVDVAQEVVDMVHESSGMFLKQADDGGEYWVAVDNESARKKVSAAFRTLRIRSK